MNDNIVLDAIGLNTPASIERIETLKVSKIDSYLSYCLNTPASIERIETLLRRAPLRVLHN